MADPTPPSQEHHPAERRRGPDGFSLALGLGGLALAIGALFEVIPGAPALDGRWLFAAAAAVLGVVLLAGALRSRRS